MEPLLIFKTAFALDRKVRVHFVSRIDKYSEECEKLEQ